MGKKNAMVTGASSGIGRVFAQELAKIGYAVTCVARSEAKLSELTSTLGNDSRYIIADLTGKDDLDSIIREIATTKYSILINNAGYGTFKRFTETDIGKISNLIELNINSLVSLSHAYLSSAVSGDTLVNVSSLLSLLPYPGGAVYSGTKAFVTNFTEALWYECKERDIYVMALLPGVTDTNFHTVALEGKEDRNSSDISYPPEVVVKDAIKAIENRKNPTVVSGPRYRWLIVFLTKLLSRKQISIFMGKNSSGL